MVVAKTEMNEKPKTCSECKISLSGYGLISCPILKNWLEQWEIEEGKTKLDNCPLEQI